MSNQIEDLFKQNDINTFMTKENIPKYKDILKMGFTILFFSFLSCSVTCTYPDI